MTEFTPIASALGGALIGAASALLLLFSGRIAGISGIVGGLVGGRPGGLLTNDRAWRGAFVAGLLAGGFLLAWLLPTALEIGTFASWPVIIVAGLLVGFGTRMSSGCTSGHGVCGLSRLSLRSLAATLTFMGTGVVTVLVVRHLFA